MTLVIVPDGTTRPPHEFIHLKFEQHEACLRLSFALTKRVLDDLRQELRRSEGSLPTKGPANAIILSKEGDRIHEMLMMVERMRTYTLAGPIVT